MLIELLTLSWLNLWRMPSSSDSASVLQPQVSFPAFALQPWDVERDRIVEDYLSSLAAQGLDKGQQGLWLQTDDALLVNHQGQQPQTPASLTKVATTLAAIKTWGLSHRFKTEVFATGPIQNGVLQGDLHIQGMGDPLLGTVDAIAIGNQLNAAGIRQVTGNLVLSGALALNFDVEPESIGQQLQAIWNPAAWSTETAADYQSLPKGTPRPQLTIAGSVTVEGASTGTTGQTVASHSSLPLPMLLKLMNIYSNNRIAEWLTALVGGPETIREIALQTGTIAPSEITLTNGSGLEQSNRLSPRAVVGLYQSIQAEIQPTGMTLGDLFPVMGQDKGTVEKRHMPRLATVKTGTLWNTSGLAGVIPTRRYGPVWFAIMNRGDDYTDGFRNAQDQFLRTLVQQWGAVPVAPAATPAIAPEEKLRYQRVERFLQADFLSH